jgi:hypothetical protein
MAEAWEVKLDRAEELRQELVHATDGLCRSGDFYAETDQAGAERAVRIVIRCEIPARLSAIVGDVLHNLRSALDCVALVTCEVGRSGPLTDAEERDVQFPITKGEPEFERRRRVLLPHAAPDAIDLIRSRQPWYLPNLAPGFDEAHRRLQIDEDLLSTLAALSNIDKHRRLHLTAWYPSAIYTGVPDGVRVRFRPNPGPIGDGSIVGYWLVDADEGIDPATVELEGHAEVAVSLQHHIERSVYSPGIEMTDFLNTLVLHVHGWVVTPLARLIGRSSV